MIVDIRLDDPRVAAVRELDIPAVFVGDPSVTGGFTTVWTDDAAAMADAIAHLAELGHRHFGRVAVRPI